MKRHARLAVLLVAAGLLTACQDSDVRTLGPESPSVSADHVPAGTGCIAAEDPTTPGQVSPCDAAHHNGTPGFFFKPPLVGNPVTVTFHSGLAGFFDVDVVSVECDPGAGNCDPFEGLAVTEEGGLYRSTWKPRKGRRGNPDGSTWRVRVSFAVGSTEILLGYRDVRLGFPPADQPANEPVLEIQNSALPIKWVVEDDFLCDNVGAGEVRCLIDFGEGGDLTLLGPGGEESTLMIGEEDPSIGMHLVTATDCSADVDVDVPTGGSRCMSIDVEPPLSAVEQLTASAVLFCDAGLSAGFLASAAVHAQNGSGTTVLPPVDVVCPAPASASLKGLDGLLWAGMQKLTSLLRARPLVATLSHGGGGGSLSDLGTDFQLAISSAMAPYQTPLVMSAAPNSQKTLKVKVTDHEGGDVQGATVYFFADATTTLDCPGGPNGAASCTVDTDASGVAEVMWNIGAVTANARALGCAIGVDGSDAPPDGGVPVDEVPGQAATCDRDPLDLDNEATRGANGQIPAVTDPFISPDDPCPAGVDCSAPVAINDLPITFTAEVCSSPTVDGVKGANEWSPDCAESADFNANLSGGSTTPVTVYWQNDGNDLYLALEVARSSDQRATSLAFEFDAGPGTNPNDETPNANDDLILLDRDNKSAATGDFEDLHLTPGCAASSGSSICGDPDVNQDGAGAVQYDSGGGFLFYEISHPLCTVDSDDFCLSSGDAVGFFLRLAMGNGAQGKTIWPGFRDYDGTDEAPPQPGPAIIIN